MNSFERYKQTLLYITSNEGGNFFAFYLPQSSILTVPGTISYNESWLDFVGLYIAMKSTPNDELLDKLIQDLESKFPAGSLQHSSFAWLSPSKDLAFDFQLMLLQRAEDEKVKLVENFTLEILNSFFLLPQDCVFTMELNQTNELTGFVIDYPLDPSGVKPQPGKSIYIPITGKNRNCIKAEIAMDESEYQSATFPKKGFYSFITQADSPNLYKGAYYALFATNQQGKQQVYTGYNMCYDPLDPYNGERTRYTNAGFSYQIIDIPEPPYKQTQLVLGASLAKQSNFVSVFGMPIKLLPLSNTPKPASYVQCALPPAYDFPYYLAPDGDFQVINDSENELLLACGLSGTEFFKIKPGSGDNGVKTILRFSANQPACVKDFPFILASPVGPPINPEASPFSDDYKTSWLTVLTSKAESTPYISQPKGSALYGLTGEMPSDKGFLGHVTNPFMFTSNEKDFFPLLPYVGLQKNDPPDPKLDEDMQTLESTVLSKQRHATIISQTPDKATLLMNSGENDVQHAALTPAGVIVKTTQNEQGSIVSWDQFLLAQKGSYELTFNQPSDQVVSAMQSSNMFLVVSNNEHLANFSNEIEMGGWVLQVNVGNDQTYGDYRNIMIFKGRKGKLYDTEVSNCLVANPKKWNQTEDFSIPQTKNNADPSQLITLSNWLQDYFKNAREQEDANFTKFNTIASDENWTGILVLRAKIKEMPEQMKGIAAGVKDPSSFYAHHFAIELSQTIIGPNGPEINGASSVFGLINYNDPAYDTKKTGGTCSTRSGCSLRLSLIEPQGAV